jgi:acyl-CoA thioester hydrolase
MGVIHHSNYIRWFEEARSAFLEDIGFPYQKMEKELKLISPVLEVEAKYRDMVYFGDTVDIRVTIASCNGIRLTLSYEVREHETQKLCTTGLTRHCFLDADGHPVSLKKSYPELFEALCQE